MDNFNNELKRWVSSGLSSQYIAKHLNVPIERVEQALSGVYDPPLPPRIRPALTPVPKRVIKTRQLRPLVRPFPRISDDMTDQQRIVALTKHGISALKIQPYLSQPISTRSISKIAVRELGPPSKASHSRAHDIPAVFLPYVHEALARLGKDRYTCELCLEPVPKGCVIHHTRYEGATVYDLMYICQSCNLARENKGLQ